MTIGEMNYDWSQGANPDFIVSTYLFFRLMNYSNKAIVILISEFVVHTVKPLLISHLLNDQPYFSASSDAKSKWGLFYSFYLYEAASPLQVATMHFPECARLMRVELLLNKLGFFNNKESGSPWSNIWWLSC